MKKHSKWLVESNFLRLTFLFVLLLQANFLQAQDKTVTGTVTAAEDGMPIPGVNVVVVGTTNGTSTDFDGNFSIQVPEGGTLEFSYIGFVNQQQAVAGLTTLDVVLVADTQQLEEVVVVGYGTQKKELVTGANLQVSGEDLQRQSTTNALQALQGQTPGVQITSTSGQPGEGLNVVIRGLGSTGNNAPLYVVDGVLTTDISYLNNADIENISILKDAASAAIYGSQAANGVVLVTTKKGRKGHAQITFDHYYGIQEVARKMDMANAREYATLINESTMNSGSSPVFSNADISQMGEGTNWMDQMFSTAKTENYTLGMSGGSDASTYSSSLSYTNQEGIVGGADLSNYERYNFRFNSEHKFYNDRITFGENLSFAIIKDNGIGVGNQYNNALRGAFQANSLIPMYDQDGNFYNTAGDSEVWLSGMSNPYASMVYGNQNRNETKKLLGNVYMEFELLKNLKFRTSLGLDYFSSQGHSFSPIYELSAYDFNQFTTATQNMSEGKSLIWDNLLTYTFDVNENHHFETMLGSSSFNYEGVSMYGSNVNLVFDDLAHAWLSNATNRDGAQITLTGGPDAQVKRMSYFGRLNYNFKETYLLNVTFRADGSSNFATGNRWGYFPSVSAGWILTNENFMDSSSNWLNYFKFRASWGQVGNQNVGNFQYLAPITYENVNYNFSGEEAVLTPGAYPNRLPNPFLTWETSEQLDFGFDARLFQSKLTVNFDWYEKTTKDWLINVPVPPTSGVDNKWINGGNVTNKGMELALTFRDQLTDDFSYSIGVNGAYNQNEVGEIPTEDGIIHGETAQLWDNSPEFYRAQNGYALGYFWGYKTAGVFQDEAEIQGYRGSEGALIQPDALPGDLKYVDANNDGVINAADKVEIGDPNPDLTYGISIGANYKALDFSIQANGVAGNQLVQSYRNTNSYGNYMAEYLDRWHGPGTSNSIPRLTLDNKNFSKFSDIYVKDGDFFRISNLTLGYDIAKGVNKENFFASQLRVYFSVLNLYTFTEYNGMDPEVGYGISSDTYNFSSGVDVGYYPRPRTYMMGLNIKF